MSQTFEILHKMPTFKMVDGRFKAHTLVTVRLKDNRVVTLLLPYPIHLVDVKVVEKELKERKFI